MNEHFVQSLVQNQVQRQITSGQIIQSSFLSLLIFCVLMQPCVLDYSHVVHNGGCKLLHRTADFISIEWVSRKRRWMCGVWMWSTMCDVVFSESLRSERLVLQVRGVCVNTLRLPSVIPLCKSKKIRETFHKNTPALRGENTHTQCLQLDRSFRSERGERGGEWKRECETVRKMDSDI